LVRGLPPSIDLGREHALQGLLVTLARERLIRSAHDCSDGGLAVTVAECCFDTNGVGAELSIASVPVASSVALNEAAALFGESASRVVLSVGTEDVTQVLERAAAARVPARVVGQTGGNRLRIAVDGRMAVEVSVDDIERIWSSALERPF